MDCVPSKPGIVGSGYADGQLSHTCTRCGTTITEDFLRVAKFRDDVKHLVEHDWPMPGTILDVKSGLATLQESDGTDQLFPNRLARRGLLVEILDMAKPGSVADGEGVKVDVTLIRDAIEHITAMPKLRHSNAILKKIDKGREGLLSTAAHHNLALAARRQTRNMMSRYWENSSPFGLDLRGAIMRQGVFTSNMHKVSQSASQPAIVFSHELLFLELGAETY
jgi:hypothetical protein